VLDSCVAVKWFLVEADSTRAIQLRDEFDQQVHEVLAPDVFPIEIAHALSRVEQRGLIQSLLQSVPASGGLPSAAGSRGLRFLAPCPDFHAARFNRAGALSGFGLFFRRRSGAGCAELRHGPSLGGSAPRAPGRNCLEEPLR
jgi:hypothetical protein